MMGYLKPLAPDARIRGLYRSYQCGLCHTIGATYGLPYRVLAGPDLVFFNILLDLVGGGEAPIERKACVVAPLVTRLPSRTRTQSTELAAAFGVYMAVEKLRDNWNDDGGWHRWLAWRAFKPGHERARVLLAENDFPIHAVEQWMKRQAEVEQAPTLGLSEAAQPSTEIARLSFGVAGRDAATREQAGELGAHVGAFLFYMDNLLDLHRDVQSGGYNALARAHGVLSTQAVPEQVWTDGLNGATQQVDALERIVAELPVTGHRSYLQNTLVWGFRDKIRRFQRLSVSSRAEAGLRTIMPPTLSLLGAAKKAATTPLRVATTRLQLAAALVLTWAFPQRAWANDWWPEDSGQLGLDTALPDTGDTGPIENPIDTGDPMFTDPERSGLAEWCCNPFVSSCGFANCDPIEGLDNLCEATCGAACDSACDDACSGVSCDPDCGC